MQICIIDDHVYKQIYGIESNTFLAMRIRACSNDITRDLNTLRNRLVLAKQHVVMVTNNPKASTHTRMISLQIVSLIEMEIERKERMLVEYSDGVIFDRIDRDYI